MKKILIFTFILFGINAFAQKTNIKQQEIATKFIEYITSGDAVKSWELFDKANNPNLTQERFSKVVKILSNNFKDFDQYDLIMVGKKYVEDKMFDMYTFKATSTKTRIITDVQIDVLFIENSNLIAGFQPKKRLNQTKASSSSVKEIEVEKSIEVEIENKNYKIIGINIVPFAEKTGLLVIQVEYVLPENINDEKIRKEAIKFVQYMIKNNYITKGKKIAKENELTLRPELGVSFYNTKTGAGYNVMLKPDEYK